MTTKTRRAFTDEFKRQAVSLLASSGRPLTQVASELGVQPSLLRSWRGVERCCEGASRTWRLGRNRCALSRADRDSSSAEGTRTCPDGARHSKKNNQHLFGPAEMRFRFIEDHRDVFLVRMMCAVLEVSASGYYAWRERPESRRAAADRELLTEVRRVHANSRRRYGSPRVHAALRREGKRVGRNRVARLMHRNGIQARQKRRFRKTTDSNHSFPLAPNLLARQFTAAAPNKIWLADITCVPTLGGWLYLAVILDMFARKVVGWAMSDTMPQELTVAALRMAITNRQPGKGLLHHSDRGSQYAAHAYRRLLDKHGMLCSMSR